GSSKRINDRSQFMVAAAKNGKKQMAGKIVQVIGSTFDVEYGEDHLPQIYNAVNVTIDVKGQKTKLVGEVQQHLGGNRVRCVALGTTDGLVRGTEAVDTGAALSLPVGKE